MERRPIARTWGTVFAVALVVYAVTTQRGVGWQDSGEFQDRAARGELVGQFGLALSHVGYMVMAWLASVGGAWAINLVSAVGAALAVANLTGVGMALGLRRGSAVTIASLVGITHTWWWLATIAEVYTWQVALFAAELWVLVVVLRAPRLSVVAALGALVGLDWTIHDLALLSIPGYAGALIWLCATRKLPWRAIAIAAAAFVVAAAPLLALAGNELAGGATVGEAIRSLLFGKYQGAVTNVGGFGRYWKVNMALTAVNLATPVTVLAVLGWRRMSSIAGRPVARVLAAVAVVHGLFYIRYPVPDQFTFVLPTMCMLAVAAMVGLDSLGWSAARVRGAAIVAAALQLAAFALAPIAARASAPGLIARERELPRDEARYWLTPWKLDEDSAQRFADAAFAEASSGAVILAGNTAGAPLVALQSTTGRGAGVVIQAEGRLPRGTVDRALRDGRLYSAVVDDDNLPPPMRGHVRYERAPGDALYKLALTAP